MAWHRKDETASEIERLRQRIAQLEATLFDQDQQRSALLILLEDLDENRREIERARREWTAAFDALRDPIFLHDHDYRILRANNAYADRAGMSVKELIGRPYWEAFPRGTGPMAICTIALDDQFEEEEEITLDSGEIFSVRAFAVRDAAGTYLHSIHVLEDVTERRRIEQAIRDSEEQLRIIAASVQDAVLMTDGDNRITFWNEAATALFGFSREEAMGRPIHTLIIPPQHRDNHLQGMTRFKTTGEGPVLGKIVELPALRKDGSEFPAEHSIAGVRFRGEWHAVGVVRDITRRLQDAERLRQVLTGTIQAVAATIEKRDPYTAGHQHRTATLAAAIAEELGLAPEHVEGIRLGALIHDIGKIYIPAEILSRPGRLSTAEFDLIKSHPQVGYDIIRDVQFPWPVAEMILQHHERFDGSGYPLGLRGDAITLEARILAVADVVEAISSHRPYRPSLGIERALDEIDKNSGSRYCPIASAACLRLFREKGYRLDND